MPAFNGTGPQGYGPKTGGGLGRCAQDASQTPYYGVGRGGFPRGGGQGFAFGGRGGRRARPRRMWGETPVNTLASAVDPQQEQEWLRRQAESLQEQLRRIDARLAELSRSAE